MLTETSLSMPFLFPLIPALVVDQPDSSPQVGYYLRDQVSISPLVILSNVEI